MGLRRRKTLPRGAPPTSKASAVTAETPYVQTWEGAYVMPRVDLQTPARGEDATASRALPPGQREPCAASARGVTSLNTWVSAGQSGPQETSGNVWRHLWFSQLEHPVGETRDAAKRPTVPGTVPQIRTFWPQIPVMPRL